MQEWLSANKTSEQNNLPFHWTLSLLPLAVVDAKQIWQKGKNSFVRWRNLVTPCDINVTGCTYLSLIRPNSKKKWIWRLDFALSFAFPWPEPDPRAVRTGKGAGFCEGVASVSFRLSPWRVFPAITHTSFTLLSHPYRQTVSRADFSDEVKESSLTHKFRYCGTHNQDRLNHLLLSSI